MAYCHGKCKGVRGAEESPAQAVRSPDGKVGVMCSCCGAFLRRVDEFTTNPDGVVVPARPANLNPDLEAITERFTDDRCQYDHVLVMELGPRGIPLR